MRRRALIIVLTLLGGLAALLTAVAGPGPGWLHVTPHPVAPVTVLAIGSLVPGGEAQATQADVRPTIERLFGLCPRHDATALHPIPGDLPCE